MVAKRAARDTAAACRCKRFTAPVVVVMAVVVVVVVLKLRAAVVLILKRLQEELSEVPTRAPISIDSARRAVPYLNCGNTPGAGLHQHPWLTDYDYRFPVPV